MTRRDVCQALPIAAALGALACLPARLHASGDDDALKSLAHVEVFAFGGVGDAGVISQGEREYRSLRSATADRARESFETLYRTGNPQAQCYALTGLRAVAPERFAALYPAAEGRKDKVSTMSGCIVSDESLGKVARRIYAGAFDVYKV